VQQLEQAVAAEPDNITKRIELARLYFDSENLMGVFEQTNAILAKDPNEPRALTYNAIARMAMGQNEQAKAMLEKVTAAEPDLLDAWVALASVRMNLGDKTAASAAIDAAIARHPEAGPRLREVFAEISTTQPEAMPPSPHATASDPLAAAPAPGTPSIHVTLSLAPSASAKSGVVYVIAKSEGENGGHPVAVRRIDGAAFPLSIDLDATSSMMGGSFPKKVRVEARLDSDGDAGTNDAADPKAFVDGVSAGSRLVMKLE
jgi:tetratricopeptide (TPR) repeat protein